MIDLFNILTEELADFGLTVSRAHNSYNGFIITCASSGQFAATVGGQFTTSCDGIRGQYVISPNYAHIEQTLQGAVATFTTQ